MTTLLPCPAALTLDAATEQATTAIGRALAPALSPGDLVALHGPMGAGKSHLARAIIRARLGDNEAEVPSPTYTLVNVHPVAGVEIWHADLYRIDPEELAEIGLADAVDHAVLLVEWPDRWPDLPARRLDITLSPAGNGRRITIAARGPGWASALSALEKRP